MRTSDPLFWEEGCCESKRKRERENGEVHAGHLEGNAARVVDGFLHGVAGNAALDELVLAELTDLED